MELACPVTAVAGVSLKRMITILLLVFTETQVLTALYILFNIGSTAFRKIGAYIFRSEASVCPLAIDEATEN